MRNVGIILSCLMAMSLPACASHIRRGPTSHHTSRKREVRGSSRVVAHAATQRSIDDSRASEIQLALTNAGYLSGDNSGHWDANTEAAMQKYQADHGWQTKFMPDSRAIIKLGLGSSAAQTN